MVISIKNKKLIIMRNKIIILICFTASMLFLAGCEEAKRFEISGNDSTPPGVPVFISSDPLPGGAKIFFKPPADEDVLSVEASYVNANGKKLRFSASFFAESLDVYGFGAEGEHAVELYALDRAGNRSEGIRVLVTTLEPVVVTVAKTVHVTSSFASMLLNWENAAQNPLYVSVDFSYTQNGTRHNYSTIFTSHQTETRSIDSLKLYADEPVSVKINVSDKYDNVVLAKDTTIVLLTDGVIAKNGWSLPEAGAEIGGVKQVNGTRMEEVIDGIIDIEVENYFISFQTNPWSLLIDLGEEYEISRIVTHQRWTGFNTSSFAAPDPRGNLYRGSNVLRYNLYGLDETAQTWERWLNHILTAPNVTSSEEYAIIGKAGDKTLIYPEEPKFSKPTRYIRFEAVTGSWLSEITLYGRKAQ